MKIIDKLRGKFINSNVQKPREVDDVLLQALLGNETITREKAMTLPAVSGAVDLICNMVACMPIKLYKEINGQVAEVPNDPRTKLLNYDTKDTLDAFQMKKAMVEDYLLGSGGYAYINRNRNNVLSLHYVEDSNITAYSNNDPIFKYTLFQVNGVKYRAMDFIKLLRRTKDGATSVGVIDQVTKVIETAYSTLVYQLGQVKSGGNKKGFLQSENKLDQETIDKLKMAWNNLYKNNTESIVVLNKGLKFQESSNTSVEMQLNESKKTLSDEINNIFHIKENFKDTFKEAIFPIIKAFECTLNKDLLLESEKLHYFFAFDISEITRADLKERYDSYKLAKEVGMKTINEMRKEEHLNAIEGLDLINLGLGSSLYDIKTGKIYTPNTNETKSLDKNSQQTEEKEVEKGGEKDE